MTRQVFTLVELRHDEEHPQELRRFDLVRDVMAEVVHDVDRGAGRGRGRRSPSCSTSSLFGDFVSLHLAAQEGIDPGPIPVLDDLKRALAGRSLPHAGAQVVATSPPLVTTTPHTQRRRLPPGADPAPRSAVRPTAGTRT